MVACGRMFKPVTRRILLVPFGAVLVSLAFAASASASASAIYKTCAAEGSMSGFSKADLQAALPGVPADLDQYNSCSARINAAIIDKATKNLGGGGGIKGTRARLKLAKINDLTTPAERKRALATAARDTKLNIADPLEDGANPAIAATAGKTLASASAPNTPVALVIGIVGLVLLLGTDLMGRLGVLPGSRKKSPGSDQRGDD